MKLLDCVEILVEKAEYAKLGVHKGMQGTIWDEECKDGCWLVYFPRYGEKADIGDIVVKEEDLKLIPVMHALLNEQIEAQFNAMGQDQKALDGNSDYMV